MVNVADLWTVDSSFMAQCLFLVSTSALFDPLITEKCECFSLDLAVMLLLQWRIQMFSFCFRFVVTARAALVQTNKRSVIHTITSSSVSFRLLTELKFWGELTLNSHSLKMKTDINTNVYLKK